MKREISECLKDPKLREEIKKIVATFHGERREIFKKRFALDDLPDDVPDACYDEWFKMTPERIAEWESQIVGKAWRRLRHPNCGKSLRDEIELV